MRRRRPRLSWRTVPGSPVRVGDRSITPCSSALVLCVGDNAVFVWNWPVGVDVEQAGVVRHMRIIDRGRLAWIGLVSVLTLLVVLAAVTSPGKGHDS